MLRHAREEVLPCPCARAIVTSPRADLRNELVATATESPEYAFRIAKGLDIPLAGAPQQFVEEARPTAAVGLVTADHPDIRMKLRTREGERVALGQPLFEDAERAGVVFPSPGAGVVVEIRSGHNREFPTAVIELDGNEACTFPTHSRAELTDLDPQHVRSTLLTSGLWTALRTRPFGTIPDPTSDAHALFVQAIDTNPLAASPDVVLDDARAAFVDGLTALSRLLDGRVYLCLGPQSVSPKGLPKNTVVARFSGPHPAGLPGTHIHALAPVGRDRSVWYIGYQDVVAIGRLFIDGRLCVERVISLAGPVVRRPRLLRTRLGTDTRELVRGELVHSESRVISGSVLGGRIAGGPATFLGRYDLQVSVVAEYRTPKPRPRSLFADRARLSSLTTSVQGPPGPMIPIEGFERTFPFDIPVIPLLRALLVGDAEAAAELGGLELEEEDLALCSYLCPGKNEYGPLLRRVLTKFRGRE